MIRINCVPVHELSDAHLIAEYREIPRVVTLAAKAVARKSFFQPDCYTLGKGHLHFFYTRLGYLSGRHAALIEELKQRVYTPMHSAIRREDFPSTPSKLWGSWQPSQRDLQLGRQRIHRNRPATYTYNARAYSKPSMGEAISHADVIASN